MRKSPRERGNRVKCCTPPPPGRSSGIFSVRIEIQRNPLPLGMRFTYVRRHPLDIVTILRRPPPPARQIDRLSLEKVAFRSVTVTRRVNTKTENTATRYLYARSPTQCRLTSQFISHHANQYVDARIQVFKTADEKFLKECHNSDYLPFMTLLRIEISTKYNSIVPIRVMTIVPCKERLADCRETVRSRGFAAQTRCRTRAFRRRRRRRKRPHQLVRDGPSSRNLKNLCKCTACGEESPALRRI